MLNDRDVAEPQMVASGSTTPDLSASNPRVQGNAS
jgi:hypothetical protein